MTEQESVVQNRGTPGGRVVTLSRFRADLGRTLARQGKNLLEANDLAAKMAELEPLEAYFVVKELGVEDAVPLLRHSSAEQLQTCIDLDCWQQLRPAFVELDAWLAPFAAEGHASLAKIFRRLDMELQVLFLAESLQICDLRSEPEPPEQSDVPHWHTPDSFFLLEPSTAGQGWEVDPLFLADALYRDDLEEAYRLLMAAKWELVSPLEEEALRFRTARLEDLGFPPIERAIEIFAPPPSRPPPMMPTTCVVGAPTRLPALYTAGLTSESLLTRALGQIDEAHTGERIEQELIFLINAAMVGYDEGPRNVAHARALAQRVCDTLCLGLEMLVHGTEPSRLSDDLAVAAAAQQLESMPLVYIFRHGHRATTDLRATCISACADPIIARWRARSDIERPDDLQDRLDHAFVEALCAVRPLHGGHDTNNPNTTKAFASRAELESARQRLTALLQRIA